MVAKSHDLTTREVRIASHMGKGLVVTVDLHHFEETDYGRTMPKGGEKVGQYAFVRLDRSDVADDVRGDVPASDGPVVAYIGGSFGKHYYRSKSRDSIPVDVYEALAKNDALLLEGVDGGWSNWDGRPEWSETYVDVSDAERVDMAEIIEERREDDR